MQELRSVLENMEGHEKFNFLGIVDYYQGKFENARLNLLIAIDSTKDPIKRLSSLANLLFVESRINHFEQCEEHLVKANEIMRQLKIDSNIETLKHLDRNIMLVAIRFFTARTYFYWIAGKGFDISLIKKLQKIPIDHLYTRLLLSLTLYRIQVLGAHNLQIISELVHFVEENIERPIFASEGFNLLGIAELFQNKYEKAIEHFKEAIEINLQIGNKYMASLNRANIASCLRRQGNINEALDLLIEAKNIEKRYGSTRNLPIILENIALCHSMKGEFIEADHYFDQALSLIGNREIPYVSASTLNEIATTKYLLGENKTALELFQKVQTIAKKQNSPLFIFKSLFYQFLIFIETDWKKANMILNELIQLSHDQRQENFRKMSDLAKALLLKSTKKLKDLGKAYEILEKLASDQQDSDFFIKIISNLHLLDLMLIEGNLTKDPNIIDKLETQIEKLKSIAQQSESALMKLELKHVEARFELMVGNIEKAIGILENGIEIAEKIGFTSQKLKLEVHKKTIEEELLMWVDQFKKNKSRIELLNQSKLRDYLKSVQKIVAAK